MIKGVAYLLIVSRLFCNKTTARNYL